jgi:4-amino-4-deoxy-L-arabinose transferase-like glycosyltransferase
MGFFFRLSRPVRVAIVLMLAVTFYRLWFITKLDLVPDEAYYWLWSRHLAASYRDKGPAVAWIIALGTRLFGQTVFGIRFFAVILSTGTGILLFQLARRLYDERVALWSLIVASVMPIIAVGSVLMTIDTPSVLSWTAAMLIFWEALHRDKNSDWLWLGLVIGAGFLAKFTNGVQLVSIAFFLLWSKEHRPLLFSRKIWIMGAAFSFSILPIIWWNMQTGWVHFTALHARSGVTNHFEIHPLELLAFIGGQFGVVSPLLMAGMVAAAIGLLLKEQADLRVRFLLSQFLPLYALFGFFSLNVAGQPNWAAPALIPGIIFTVVFWRSLVSRVPQWRWGVGAALGIASAMTIVMHDTDYLHLRPKQDPLRRAKGWEDFAAHVQAARDKYQANLLIADNYSQASIMAFYLHDQPTTYLLPEPYGATQFTLWPEYRVTPDSRALYVTTSTGPPPDGLKDQFKNVILADDFWSQHAGRNVREFQIFFCSSQPGPDVAAPGNK